MAKRIPLWFASMRDAICLCHKTIDGRMSNGSRRRRQHRSKGWQADGCCAESNLILLGIIVLQVFFLVIAAFFVVFLVVLALGAIVVLIIVVVVLVFAATVQHACDGVGFGAWWETSSLVLHLADDAFERGFLTSQDLHLLIHFGPLLGHFEDVAIAEIEFARDLKILLFEALRLLGHVFHLFAKGEEEVIGVVQRVLDLLEFFHVDVQLVAELVFGLRKGSDLLAECLASRSFVLSDLTLTLVASEVELHISLFRSNGRPNMLFAELIVVDQ